MEFLIVVFLLLLGYGIFLYNRLVRLRQQVRTAWSDIEVQLKRRHDLIPKLVDAVRQYAGFERATLSAVTGLRQQCQQAQGAGELGALESALGSKLHQFFALAEAYPDLKANQSFLDLQRQISEVENTIQYARRYYNGSVREYNTRVESFPDLLLAGPMRFSQASYFDYHEAPAR